MPRYEIIHVEAVWERSKWTVEAENLLEAKRKLNNGDADIVWKEITGSVDSMDDEIESIEEVED